jgi:transcription antitermination factor NusB
MRKRTLAREIALQALYQHDLPRKRAALPTSASGGPVAVTADDLEAFIEQQTGDAEARAYARRLVDGAIARGPEIDAMIEGAVRHWKLNRLAPVDRSVLRLGIFELLECTDVPPKVVINEAIDLAKKFSTEQSGAFVNGILDRIYTELRKK